ncbi:CBS domain-containing protein [Candidatus Competibacter phosphatis]|uniref:CBS domain-containing protein n=1 Tax=Candidatus Competibacter phosphatis TaxID=221280 RepID=A0ABX1TN73_9GAMM|nr:CBS domain-containing protein [Candidatus Competibacter phosphatis]
MKPAYRPLPLHRLDRGIRHARPKQQLPWRVTADDPALSVMTDLCQVAAVTTELSIPLDQGLDIMIKRGVRVLLVVDADDHILGLVTSRDIDGEKSPPDSRQGRLRPRGLARLRRHDSPSETGGANDGRLIDRASGRHYRDPAAGQPSARPGVGNRSRNRNTGGTRPLLALGDRLAAGVEHQSIAATDHLCRIGEGRGSIVITASAIRVD